MDVSCMQPVFARYHLDVTLLCLRVPSGSSRSNTLSQRGVVPCYCLRPSHLDDGLAFCHTCTSCFLHSTALLKMRSRRFDSCILSDMHAIDYHMTRARQQLHVCDTYTPCLDTACSTECRFRPFCVYTPATISANESATAAAPYTNAREMGGRS